MTPQEINERIGALLGYTKQTGPIDGIHQFCETQWMLGKRPIVWLPNYAESLDACREFEGTIGRLSLEYYAENLAVAVWGSAVGNTLSYLGASQLITATPRQRCEAFLRMKGQWDEN